MPTDRPGRQPELFVNPDLDPKRDASLDRELKSLPLPKAPDALVPALMALLAARARVPWWQRAWWDWPLPAKAAFLILTLSVAALISGGGHVVGEGVADFSTDFLDRFNPFGLFLDILAPLGAAGLLVWEMLVQPFLLYAAVAAGALYLACVAMGTACLRYALKRA